MTIKELFSELLSLIWYVPYIIDVNPKIQWFIRFMPLMFKEWIEYDNPKTLEEAMRKAKLFYDQNKNKRESISASKNQRPNNFDSKRKQNKFHKSMRNNHRGYQGNNYKFYKPQDYVVPSIAPNKNPSRKEPLKYWECREQHYFKDFL